MHRVKERQFDFSKEQLVVTERIQLAPFFTVGVSRKIGRPTITCSSMDEATGAPVPHVRVVSSVNHHPKIPPRYQLKFPPPGCCSSKQHHR
jgi:hypothetical protein